MRITELALKSGIIIKEETVSTLTIFNQGDELLLDKADLSELLDALTILHEEHEAQNMIKFTEPSDPFWWVTVALEIATVKEGFNCLIADVVAGGLVRVQQAKSSAPADILSSEFLAIIGHTQPITHTTYLIAGDF